MGNNKKFILGFFLALAVLTIANFAVADNSWTELGTPDITHLEVYVNDAITWVGHCEYNATTLVWNCSTFDVAIPAIERGETATVKAIFSAGNDIDNAKVSAEITGYSKDIEAQTSVFDVFANSVYTRTLNLEIPNDIDEDSYTLHLEIESKSSLSGINEAKADIVVQRVAELLEILSAECYGNFEAGSMFYTDVVVKNRGSDETEDIYVKASISELGISRTVYLGDLEEVDNEDDDAKKVTVAMTLPETARPGSYQLKIKAYNSKMSVDAIENIVVKDASTSGKEGVVITPGTTTASVERGKGAAYEMKVANYGSKTVEVEIETEGTEGWATTQITPETFSLAAGQEETAIIYLVVNEDAVEAEHVFSVKVSYDGSAEHISFGANVGGAASTLGLKTVLMIIALVLGVVIIVLLIVLLTKKDPSR